MALNGKINKVCEYLEAFYCSNKVDFNEIFGGLALIVFNNIPMS